MDGQGLAGDNEMNTPHTYSPDCSCPECVLRERDQLRGGVEALRAKQSTPGEWQRLIAELTAENERLRAALKMAVIWGASMAEAPDPARPVWFDMARAALKEKP